MKYKCCFRALCLTAWKRLFLLSCPLVSLTLISVRSNACKLSDAHGLAGFFIKRNDLESSKAVCY